MSNIISKTDASNKFQITVQSINVLLKEKSISPYYIKNRKTELVSDIQLAKFIVSNKENFFANTYIIAVDLLDSE